MVQYTIRRLISAIPVLVGILIVTFALARLIPGDPCRSILGEKATVAVCEQFARDHGLDKPIPVQFAIYARDIMRGDFGDSIRFSRPVLLILIERLPVTIELGLTALTIALLIGVPAGILSATRHNSAVDIVTMVGANIGVSIPVFWLGLMLAYTFSLLLKDTPFQLPPSGRVTAGVSVPPFFEVFGWTVEEGTPRFYFLEFFANLYIFNTIITFNWAALWDIIKHLLEWIAQVEEVPHPSYVRKALELAGWDE